MHSSRMRTVRNSGHLLLGGLHTPQDQTPPRSRHSPGAGTPLEQAPPPGADPPEQAPPGSRHSPAARHAGIEPPPHCKACWDSTPCCKACWDTTCSACWDTTPPPVDRMTDTCKNITFATSLRTVTMYFYGDSDLI